MDRAVCGAEIVVVVLDVRGRGSGVRVVRGSQRDSDRQDTVTAVLEMVYRDGQRGKAKECRQGADCAGMHGHRLDHAANSPSVEDVDGRITWESLK